MGYRGRFLDAFVAYLVVQGLDGNLLVPVLFSEAVNLHPLVIILSVIILAVCGVSGAYFCHSAGNAGQSGYPCLARRIHS